jgi:hypothetical protein
MGGNEFMPVPGSQREPEDARIAMQHLETLTKTEVERRKVLLLRLKDALAERQVTSALAGRRTIVLRSAQDGEGRGGYREPVRLADPQLYVFAAGGVNVVTTDAEFYWLSAGHPHPTADPGGAAQAYARFSRPPS